MLVFFDYDGTISINDTILPLAVFLARKRQKYWIIPTLKVISYIVSLKTRIVSNHWFKERFAKLLLTGESVEIIEKLAATFHDRNLDSNLNRQIYGRLLWHVERGDDVYLVSSNYDFFLQPLVRRWRLTGLIATETEVENGIYTGKLRGTACYGREKLLRVVGQFGEDCVKEAVSYGDDPKSDAFLMEAVKEAHWVHGLKGRWREGRKTFM